MPDYLIKTTIPATATIDSAKLGANSLTVEGSVQQAAVSERIVRAKNEAQAIRHVVADTLTVERATMDDAIRIGKIETAKGEA